MYSCPLIADFVDNPWRRHHFILPKELTQIGAFDEDIRVDDHLYQGFLVLGEFFFLLKHLSGLCYKIFIKFRLTN